MELNAIFMLLLRIFWQESNGFKKGAKFFTDHVRACVHFHRVIEVAPKELH